MEETECLEAKGEKRRKRKTWRMRKKDVESDDEDDVGGAEEISQMNNRPISKRRKLPDLAKIHEIPSLTTCIDFFYTCIGKSAKKNHEIVMIHFF